MKNLITIALSLFVIACYGQTTMTRDEIMQSWVMEKKDSATDISNLSADPKLNARIRNTINSLARKNIDSFIIYTSAHPGYSNTSACLEFTYPIFCYVLWPRNDSIFAILIKGKCEFSMTKPDSTGIFNFCKANQSAIDSEMIMPAIVNAERDENQSIKYNIRTTTHEARYSLYIIKGHTIKAMHFTPTDVQYPGSLFYQDNMKLKSIALWKLIKKHVTDQLR